MPRSSKILPFFVLLFLHQITKQQQQQVQIQQQTVQQQQIQTPQQTQGTKITAHIPATGQQQQQQQQVNLLNCSTVRTYNI